MDAVRGRMRDMVPHDLSEMLARTSDLLLDGPTHFLIVSHSRVSAFNRGRKLRQPSLF